MNKNKIVGYWLLTGVFMLIIQVLLGGITRLTGSGLSITEWKPILGSIPPLNEQDWQMAFSLYQEKTGQKNREGKNPILPSKAHRIRRLGVERLPP